MIYCLVNFITQGGEEHGEKTREQDEERQTEQHSSQQSKGVQDMALDLGDKTTGPKQLKVSQYPLTQFETQKRSFQENWFKSFKWLEYSSQKNAAFCFACRVFGKSLRYDTLVNDGVSNWQKALSKFQKHKANQSHKDSVVCWNSYKASLSQGNIVEQIEAASATEVSERREYLERIVAVTCFLGKQGISF